jgi:hypothetical protein
MEYGSVHGASQLKPIRAAASMAMVTGRTETNFTMMAFSSLGLTPIDVDTSKTIQEVCHAFSEVCVQSDPRNVIIQGSKLRVALPANANATFFNETTTNFVKTSEFH